MEQRIQQMFGSPGHVSPAELHAYLQGNASPELVRKVELAMLDEEPLVSEAVEGYEEMGMTALPAFEDFSEFKKKLPELEGAKVVRLNPARRLMRVAVVAIALVTAMAGYFAWQANAEQDLYSQFYQPYQNDISLTQRGAGEAVLQPDLQDALSTYARGDYAASLPAFEKALATEPNNEAAHFFAGMAYLEAGDAAEAIDHFNLASIGEGTYARKAHWYAILTALKLGDQALASDLLDQFLEKKGYKDAEARRLREKF